MTKQKTNEDIIVTLYDHRIAVPVRDLIINYVYKKTKYDKKKIAKRVNETLAKLPEQGEVIFKGMVNLIDLDDLFLAVFKEKVEKYQGKEIQIIIREVK